MERSASLSLFEKIKVCVEFDLKHMEPISTVKLQKQTNRLYDACMLMPDAQEYINERYEDIMNQLHRGRKRRSPP